MNYSNQANHNDVVTKITKLYNYYCCCCLHPPYQFLLQRLPFSSSSSSFPSCFFFHFFKKPQYCITLPLHLCFDPLDLNFHLLLHDCVLQLQLLLLLQR
jgi:hypothetical protein